MLTAVICLCIWRLKTDKVDDMCTDRQALNKPDFEMYYAINFINLVNMVKLETIINKGEKIQKSTDINSFGK